MHRDESFGRARDHEARDHDARDPRAQNGSRDASPRTRQPSRSLHHHERQEPGYDGRSRGREAPRDAYADDGERTWQPARPPHEREPRDHAPASWDDAPTWKSWDDDEFGRGGQGAGREHAGRDARRARVAAPTRSRWDEHADAWDDEWQPARGWDSAPEPAYAGRSQFGAAAGRAIQEWRDSTQRWATAQKQRFLSTRRGRITAIVLGVCLLSCILGSIPTSVFAAAQYHEVSALAHDALTHLKNAEADAKTLSKSPFNAQATAALRAELVAAHSDFVQVSSRLQMIPGITQFIPIAGSKIGAAFRLVPIAVEGTQAGIIGCDALSIVAGALKNPLDPTAQGLTPQVTAKLTQDVDQLVALFNTMVQQINTLQPSDLTLDPRLGPAIAGFRTQLPKIQMAVQGVQTIVHLAPVLLGVGQPTNYLVEIMDSTELRPGGGFIGNYGIVSLSGGRFSIKTMQDVDLLDVNVKYGNLNIPIPPQYSWLKTLIPTWGFRDSNLDADFPTSAQYGEQLYVKEMQANGQQPEPVQGVIAITPWLIQNAMKITGPIVVPDYNETVTAANLVDEIHKHALGIYTGPDTTYDPTSGSSLRKRFTGLLFKAFMAKVKQDLSGNFSKYAQLMIDALHSKDLQIYLNPKPAETVLQEFGLASAIQAPPTGDSVFEVDANIGGNKSNYFLTYAMNDQITLDQSGTATHHLTISYAWPYNPASLYYDFAAGINNRYHSYSRLYVPPTAVLKSESGWVNPSKPATAFGRQVWSGTTYVYYNNHLDVTLTWTVPHAATHDASGWHYTLLFQKQAGITWQLNLQVTLPGCATLDGQPKNFTTVSGHTVSVKEPLANDVQFGVDYTGC
jgi:hypothetical protein